MHRAGISGIDRGRGRDGAAYPEQHLREGRPRAVRRLHLDVQPVHGREGSGAVGRAHIVVFAFPRACLTSTGETRWSGSPPPPGTRTPSFFATRTSEVIPHAGI